MIEKFATRDKADVAYGTLFSHVVIGSAPRARELKIPYFVVSEGHHVASGMLNRYTLQPGITDVKSQVQAMAPFVHDNLGKKVTLIFPDFAFGHDHRDYFTKAMEAQGGKVIAQIAIPPTETSFTKYFARIPGDTEVIHHVMVGPAVPTFVKEMDEFLGPSRPEIFGFIDNLEAVDLTTPGLEFLEGTYFWEGDPRYAQKDQTPFDKFYRQHGGWTRTALGSRIPRTFPPTLASFGVFWEPATLPRIVEWGSRLVALVGVFFIVQALRGRPVPGLWQITERRGENWYLDCCANKGVPKIEVREHLNVGKGSL